MELSRYGYVLVESVQSAGGTVAGSLFRPHARSLTLPWLNPQPALAVNFLFGFQQCRVYTFGKGRSNKRTDGLFEERERGP